MCKKNCALLKGEIDIIGSSNYDTPQVGLNMEWNVPCSVDGRQTFEFIGQKIGREASEPTETEAN